MRGVPQTGLVPPNARGGAPPAIVPAPAPATAARPPIAPAPAAVQQAATGLPPDAPKLIVSGGVYSPSAAQRMLIVNGQVFNEGSEVAPGVTVDEIKPRTAVLKFRGTRYTITY